MKMLSLKLSKAVLIAFALMVAGIANASISDDIEWTKTSISKVASKGGDGSFILGNGMINLFPEASEAEIMEGSIEGSFTVYDRFRIIVSLMNRMALPAEDFAAAQQVPTGDLLKLAQKVIAGNGMINIAAFDELVSKYEGYKQYRAED